MSFAIVMHTPGGPEVLKYEPVARPEPTANQVQVRHAAVGVNFHDAYVRSGLYQTLPLPGTPGIEAVGIVEKVGANVADFAPGDRVAYITKTYGADAEYNVVDHNILIKVPAALPDDVVASMLLKGLTAQALITQVYPVKQGDWVLIHAAAGGVGLLLSQWAKHLGAKVIGTVSTQQKAQVARQAGCDHIIFYRDEDFVAKTLSITEGKGVQVVYDSVGNDTFLGSLACLAPTGHLASLGQSSGPVAPFEVSALFAKSNSVSRPNVFQYLLTPQQLRAAAASLFDTLAQGIIQAGKIQSLPLKEAAQAHNALESRDRIGSLVLIP